MEGMVHLSINLFPMAMLIIIYGNNRKKSTGELDRQLLDTLILSIVGMMLADVLRWFLHGEQVMKPVVWIANMLYLILVVFMISMWVWYTHIRIYGRDSKKNSKMQHILGIIFVLYMVVVISAPWNGWIFRITSDNWYQRGTFWSIPFLVCAVELLYGISISLWHWKHDVSLEKKAECGYLALFGVLPFICGVMQWFVYGWCLIGAAISISILLLYVNTQNMQLIKDALTGLNNRREFDKFLEARMQQGQMDFGMLMIDIDDFKQINDIYGHIMGDEALWETADILKTVLHKENAFIARYGGDEFGVIFQEDGEQAAQRYIDMIQKAVVQRNAEKRDSYQLSLSIGYALRTELEERNSGSELVELSDQRMYRIKEAKKQTNDGGLF